ncbi:MAG: type II toxin-antitoxin system VapC family toxin [Rhodocyclaceae bacterium]|nr:type II toxin-antitoxin system VapC family toxin [Rhodocyclaceae bacterium]
MFLLDTVVVSELRKRRPSPAVLSWLAARQETELFLSVITLGEIQRGIAAKRADDPAFARELQRWLEALPRLYGDRVLPVTAAIAQRWGELSWRAGHGGADLVIAATALEHRLTVVTRNVRHFEPLGVPVFNPFTRS